MKYMLLIYPGAEVDFDSIPEDQQRAIYEEYGALAQAPGVGDNHQLQPATSATTVRVQDGRTLTTDGPFVETKEQLGGYYVLEADDIDAAIEMASRVPAARMGGAVEIRPLVER